MLGCITLSMVGGRGSSRETVEKVVDETLDEGHELRFMGIVSFFMET